MVAHQENAESELRSGHRAARVLPDHTCPMDMARFLAVRADMVEANEFPQLSMKYNVMGVPRTVINEDTFIEGAAPEAMLLAKLREAMAN